MVPFSFIKKIFNDCNPPPFKKLSVGILVFLSKGDLNTSMYIKPDDDIDVSLVTC